MKCRFNGSYLLQPQLSDWNRGRVDADQLSTHLNQRIAALGQADEALSFVVKSDVVLVANDRNGPTYNEYQADVLNAKQVSPLAVSTAMAFQITAPAATVVGHDDEGDVFMPRSKTVDKATLVVQDKYHRLAQANVIEIPVQIGDDRDFSTSAQFNQGAWNFEPKRRPWYRLLG